MPYRGFLKGVMFARWMVLTLCLVWCLPAQAALTAGVSGDDMAYIPPGEFRMGSNDGEDDEKLAHTVYVDGSISGSPGEQ